jgi:hypothetical protein
METLSPQKILDVAMFRGRESSPTKLGASGLPERRTSESASLFYNKKLAEIGTCHPRISGGKFLLPVLQTKELPH